MTIRAIINADDFGLSPGVNRGIVSAFHEGVLTSTTMLVNMESFADAVALARDNPDLGVGVHLSLLWGRPVSDPSHVPTLVEAGGSFPRSLSSLASRYYLGRLSLDQVRREFLEQIRSFLDAGLTPTHVDTHKHVHCLPGILDALIAAVREHGIRKLRLPSEERLDRGAAAAGAPGKSWKAAGKRRLIRFLCRGARPRLRQAGLRTTDHFVGIESMACLNSDVLRRILSNLRSGDTEIMCHPGYADEQARRYSATPPHRETELESLKDPRIKDCIASGAIRLIDYGDL